MKRTLLLLLILFGFSSTLEAQDVVSWTGTYNPKTSMIEIRASISPGWHLYSQYVDNSVGPVPTSFSFKSSNDFALSGSVQEPKAIQKYDENFEAMLDFFEKEVVFTQKVDVEKKSVLEATVTFMVCNETMCLPPVDQKIKIELIP